MAYDFNSLTKQAAEASNRDKFYTDFGDVDTNVLHQITELTEWMRTKAKGSDVREVIAQLFERTWVEAIKEGNTNLEVAKARGSHPSLDARLGGLDAKDTDLQNQINTNKTSITTTGSRIDNLIANAGNGTVPSERIDIRVAYDGKSYNTAEKAVREQFTKLSKGVLAGNMVLPFAKSEAITHFVNPSGLNNTSGLVPGSDLKHLIIKDVLEGGTRVSVQVNKTQETGLDPRFTIAQYDSSSGAKVGELVSSARNSGTFDLPQGYLYTIIFATDADLTPANVNTYFTVDIIHYSVDYASKSITNFVNPLGWNNISELVPGGNLKYLVIKDVLEGGTRVSVQVDKTQATGLDPRFTIVQFDSSSGAKVGELVTGVKTGGTFDLPQGYLYTILFAINGATDADLTQANVNRYFKVGIILRSFDYAPKSITLDKISDETIKALSAPSAPPTKTMHMSFDDTWQCLYDLITNKISYSSIFDNAFLNDLKDVHDATGMVFTLNCFNAYSGQTSYNISDLAELTKFRDEFRDNLSWLRFSFHAQDDKTRYDSDKTSQIVQSYNTFTDAIYQLTGTTDSIDTVVRLGFFTGTLNNCLAIRNAPCGISGILAADDNRSDYYFDSATRSYLASHGFDYDLTNRLKLCKTIKRLESITDLSSELANYDGLVGANKNKRLEFFTHEYAWTPKIKSMLLQIGAWANARGYSHLYLQDV